MERRRHTNETPGISGEMSIDFDFASGQVRSVATGFWSIGQVRAFFEDWKWIVHQIHSSGRIVSALVDMSEGQVQKADVAAYIASATTDLYHAGDFIAMLVPTSLAKMQMRRVLDPRFHEFFLSRNAAETWLDAKSLGAGSIGHFAA